jgi:D-serine dehydratase
VSIRGFAISNASAADLAEAARTINHGLSRGILSARIGALLSLAESAEAHRLQENGARGRTVVLPPVWGELAARGPTSAATTPRLRFVCPALGTLASYR